MPRCTFGRFRSMSWRKTVIWGSRLSSRHSVASETVWFAVDTISRRAKMVNRCDVDKRTINGLAKYIEGQEALFVATGGSIAKFRDANPTLLSTLFDLCLLMVPVDDLFQMDGYLVTPGKIVVFNGAPDLGLDNIERVTDPVAIAALFADT